MDTNKERLSIAAAKLYYESDYSQQDICDHFGMSRPTVSRLLQYAKDNGYVKIEVVDPFENINDISRKLKDIFELDDVLIAHSPIKDYTEVIKHITDMAANYLDDLITDGDILGVSWGETTHMLSTKIKNKDLHGVEVVQLKGGMSYSQTQTHAAETISLFARAYNTIARYLPLPVIFDKQEVKQMVLDDRHIQRVIEMGRQANIAVFTVGAVNTDSLLLNLGYFNEREKAYLQQNAIGDICSRFINTKGEISSHELDRRTVGIELDELRKKETSILVAGGEHKVQSIHAALTGRYANTLITDQYTASALLETQMEMEYAK